jgi:hypothetical protein
MPRWLLSERGIKTKKEVHIHMIPTLEKNTSPGVVQCQSCGTVSTHVTVPGKGPHFRQLRCQRCGCHIKWRSDRTPEERTRVATERRDAYLASQLPSAKQISYLGVLGYTGRAPLTRLEASRLISHLLEGRNDD